MCGPSSALGLADDERAQWPQLRDRLRQPGRLMALMRGVLGGETEVAAVVALTPDGTGRPLALLVTEGIAAEITLLDDADETEDVRRAHVGDYDVDVLIGTDKHGERRPIAMLMTPWLQQHLYLYSRKLWNRPGTGFP